MIVNGEGNLMEIIILTWGWKLNENKGYPRACN